MIYRLMKRQDDEDIPHIVFVYRLPSVSRFISIDETNYWTYVTTTDNVYFYKVFEDDVLIATTHLELIDRTLYMDVVVFPEFQKRGIATNIVNDIQAGKLGADFDKIAVSIDAHNIASLQLFENAGFICVAKDGELLEYEYTKGCQHAME